MQKDIMWNKHFFFGKAQSLERKKRVCVNIAHFYIANIIKCKANASDFKTLNPIKSNSVSYKDQ